MSKITLEQVKAEVIKLGQEQPDFIYNPAYDPLEFSISCFYTEGAKDGPECNGCIFGQALQNLGVPLEKLETTQTIEFLLSDLGIAVTTEESHHLRKVQEQQDTGKTWGEAIKPLL